MMFDFFLKENESELLQSQAQVEGFLREVEVPRDKTTLSLNSQCLPCLGGNLILNNTTDTLK